MLCSTFSESTLLLYSFKIRRHLKISVHHASYAVEVGQFPISKERANLYFILQISCSRRARYNHAQKRRMVGGESDGKTARLILPSLSAYALKNGLFAPKFDFLVLLPLAHRKGDRGLNFTVALCLIFKYLVIYAFLCYY